MVDFFCSCRILSRVIPFIFEDPDWRSFFWSRYRCLAPCSFCHPGPDFSLHDPFGGLGTYVWPFILFVIQVQISVCMILLVVQVQLFGSLFFFAIQVQGFAFTVIWWSRYRCLAHPVLPSRSFWWSRYICTWTLIVLLLV